jgi:hypothetical protein
LSINEFSSTETIEAIASGNGYSQSAVASAAYTITPPAATPTFSVTPGTYTSTQTVSISDSTPGVTIFYTTNSTTPTTSSSIYSGPITVSSTETIEAIASGNGYSQSAVASAAYTINLPTMTHPTLTGVLPAYIEAGSGAFTITIKGTEFTTDSKVYWESSALETQFVTDTKLSAQVPPSEISTPGVYAVTVRSSASNVSTSNQYQFEVDTALASSRAPSFSSTTATVAAGATANYPVTVSSVATSVSVTCLNLPAGATCSYSGTNGTVTVATSSTTPAGTYQVQ